MTFFVFLLLLLGTANAEDPVSLYGVDFPDTLTGYVVGNRGTVYKTGDGGKRWQKLSLPTHAVLQRCCFINAREGWVAGGEERLLKTGGVGVVFHTADGGKTWVKTYPPMAGMLFDIRFLDAKKGFACGQANDQYDNALFTTEDGGLTWRSLLTGQKGWLYGMTVLDGGRAVVAGSEDGRVVRTGAGRDSRILQTLPRPKGRTRFNTLRSVRFSGPLTGLAVGDNAHIARTTDGGKSWKAAKVSIHKNLVFSADLRDAAFAGGGRAVAVGGIGGSALVSPDSGKSWTVAPLPRKSWLWGIDFSGDRHGWIVGDMGTILHTPDGGLTWESQSLCGEQLDILYVVPHHDDDAYGACTLARLSLEQGYRVGMLFTARDDRRNLYYFGEPSYLEGRFAGNAAYVLPVRTLEEQDLGDRTLAETVADWRREYQDPDPQAALNRLVTSAVRAYRPTVILTHEPEFGDYNKMEHKFCGRAATAAFRAAGNPDSFPEQLAAGLEPWQPQRLYYKSSPRLNGRPQSGAHPPHMALFSGTYSDSLRATFSMVTPRVWLRYKSKHISVKRPVFSEFFHLAFCLDEEVRQELLPPRVPGRPADSAFSALTALPYARNAERYDRYAASNPTAPYAAPIYYTQAVAGLHEDETFNPKAFEKWMAMERDTGLVNLVINEFIRKWSKNRDTALVSDWMDRLFKINAGRGEFADEAILRGQMYYAAGLFEKSAPWLERALERKGLADGVLAELHCRLGVLSRLRGDTAGARLHFLAAAQTRDTTAWQKTARSEWAFLSGAGAPAKKTTRGRACAGPIQLDGRMDEPAWRKAKPEMLTVPQRKGELRAPWQKTEFRVLYDSAAIYLFAKCSESRMPLCIRNPGKDLLLDGFILALDPPRTYSRKYEMVFYPASLKMEMFGGFKGLDSLASFAVALNSESWTVEVRFDRRALGGSAASGKWGLHVGRDRMAAPSVRNEWPTTVEWTQWEMAEPNPWQDLPHLFGYLVLD